jgi:hypothetical protein
MRFRAPAAALCMALAPGTRALAQAGVAAPYETRGRLVEAHRQAMQSGLEHLRAEILDTLRNSAPDLVARLDPAPPPVAQGYQLLPRLVGDTPQPADTGRRASLYSWPWTDTLIARGMVRVDSLGKALGRSAKQRPDYERLVTDFNSVLADRRLIDAHVEHNWFWQRAIAADTARFLRASRLIDSTLANLVSTIGAAPAMPHVEVTLDDSGQGPATIRVPIVTDIEDTVFVRAAQSLIERQWTGRANGQDYRVLLDIRFVDPVDLYCGPVPADCAPPERGATLDLPAHVARFPASLAVLTTGGTQPYVLGGRAMILGPRDLAPRTLAHEFGHILGFDDAYLRGYRNLADDGYAIIELIPDRSDVMASSGVGVTLPRHFAQLVANLRAERAMKAGLSAMYERNAPRAAVPLFREVLANFPEHYGATYQLAKALDQSGDSASALPVWKRMLDLARAAGDSATLQSVKSRLGIPETSTPGALILYPHEIVAGEREVGLELDGAAQRQLRIVEESQPAEGPSEVVQCLGLH